MKTFQITEDKLIRALRWAYTCGQTDLRNAIANISNYQALKDAETDFQADCPNSIRRFVEQQQKEEVR